MSSRDRPDHHTNQKSMTLTYLGACRSATRSSGRLSQLPSHPQMTSKHNATPLEVLQPPPHLESQLPRPYPQPLRSVCTYEWLSHPVPRCWGDIYRQSARYTEHGSRHIYFCDIAEYSRSESDALEGCFVLVHRCSISCDQAEGLTVLRIGAG